MTRLFCFAAMAMPLIAAQNGPGSWRVATESELKAVIPARAPVQKEQIETEFRTASGITDGKGRFVAGVVLITAGYSAEGKYSHYLLAQVPVKLDDLSLKPGEYVFGWRRDSNDSLLVSFYEAQTGAHVGDVRAVRNSRTGKIQSFEVQPPGEKAMILIGRFGFLYKLGG